MKEGKYRRIDGQGDVDAIFSRISAAIDSSEAAS